MALFQTNFISYTLVREVQMNVIVPTITCPESMGFGLPEGQKPSHAGKAPYPVLYLLHGFANNGTVWGRYTSLERYAEERQIAVVTISAENKGYRNQPAASNTGLGLMGSGDRHFDFLAYEVPEVVKANFHVSDRPEDTYIAGLSMGSMGSLLHSLSNPQNFRAVGAFSGPMLDMSKSIGLTPEQRAALTEADWDGMVSEEAKELVAKAKAEGKKLPDYYIATGTQDNPQGSAAFARFLEKEGAKVTTNFTRNYGHEWQFWDESIKEFLDWLPRTDAYAGTLRRI